MQASAAQGAAGGAPQLTEEQAERLVQAEAATARTLDAEVSFKFDVFVEETIYNLLGPYCLPYLLYRRGYTAAANRLYVGCQVMLVAQFLWSSGVILLNILHGASPPGRGRIQRNPLRRRRRRRRRRRTPHHRPAHSTLHRNPCRHVRRHARVPHHDV